MSRRAVAFELAVGRPYRQAWLKLEDASPILTLIPGELRAILVGAQSNEFDHLL